MGSFMLKRGECMKLCFSTLGCHDLVLDSILDLANKYGIEAIEVRGINNELDNEKIDDFKLHNAQLTMEKFKSHNVVLYSLGTSCSFHDPNTRKQKIEKGFRELHIANSLNIKNIRVFGNNILDSKEISTNLVIDGLKTMCEYALPYDVTVLLIGSKIVLISISFEFSSKKESSETSGRAIIIS